LRAYPEIAYLQALESARSGRKDDRAQPDGAE
jgi:hypothetical protein